ncbi:MULTISPECIES: hypothetical protein [Photorhabdus]|nr:MULTISPECIES: hypothetical protein [Photorhabdus]
MTGVSECSQQRGNLKDDGYIYNRECIEYKSVKLFYQLINKGCD